MHLDNLAYFWLAAIFSLALLIINLSTLKRVGHLKKKGEFGRCLLWSNIILFLGMTLAGSKLDWEKPMPIKEKMEIIFALDVSLSPLAKDAEIEEEMAKLAEAYKNEPDISERVRSDESKQYLGNIIKNRKAVGLLKTLAIKN